MSMDTLRALAVIGGWYMLYVGLIWVFALAMLAAGDWADRLRPGVAAHPARGKTAARGVAVAGEEGRMTPREKLLAAQWPRLESYRVSREPKMLDGQRPPRWKWRFL